MNNPSWRAEDGQLLRSLREEAGIDALVFARNNTVSLAQLKELESGGNNSFYNPAIKRNTGVKLLKKLGHELVVQEPVKWTIESAEPHHNEPPCNIATTVAPALVNHPTPPSNSRARKLIQQTMWGSLGLLSVVALSAMKPWGMGDASASHLDTAVLVTQDPLTKALSKSETQPSATENQKQRLPAPDLPALALTASIGESPVAAIKVSTPAPASACDWQHRDNSTTHTPSQPLKPGNYVHLEAQADTELCVLDSQNQRTLLKLKAGMAKSVYGSAPFLVHSPDLNSLKLFFQGRRVHEALGERQHLVLNSQPH